MLPHQRELKILQSVQANKTCTINELLNELDVSKVTLYRDLRDMEQRSLIRRVRGGVAIEESRQVESRFSVRLQAQAAQKEKIGRHAAALVQGGTGLFIDASTTCLVFARALAARLLERPVEGLTIATNSPLVPLEFEGHPQVRVISTGGELLPSIKAFSGPLCISLLSELHFNLAIISCAGVSAARGVTTESPLLAEITRTAAAQSSQVWLLADSSKFGRQAILTALAADALHQVVTDEGAPQTEIEEFRQKGVEVTLVS
jgi:DeoR/GlpR family transcriptional regulator of sugar metabolism